MTDEQNGVWDHVVICWPWVSGTAWQGLRSLEALAAARVVYIVCDYSTDCFCSSAAQKAQHWNCNASSSFFHGPMPSLKKGDFGHVARHTYLWPCFICWISSVGVFLTLLWKQLLYLLLMKSLVYDSLWGGSFRVIKIVLNDGVYTSSGKKD